MASGITKRLDLTERVAPDISGPEGEVALSGDTTTG